MKTSSTVLAAKFICIAKALTKAGKQAGTMTLGQILIESLQYERLKAHQVNLHTKSVSSCLHECDAYIW